jgi:phosphoglycerate dehydrogenase-like enzyme
LQGVDPRERAALRILVAVDDFTEAQLERMREATRAWAVLRRISQSSPAEQYRTELQGADIVVGWPDPKSLVDTRVRLVQLGSSGWDAYEYQGLEGSGIAICSGRGIYTTGVAEHCIAMMLALTRRLPTHVKDKGKKIFQRHAPYAELTGATACIVGLGSIGMDLASRCKGLQMRVIGVAREALPQGPAVDEVFSSRDLASAVHRADHVFMTASGHRGNHNLFNRDVLQSFRPTSYFYNVSRGSTVDEEALYELLADGKIAGAGLDVTLVEPLPESSPLWNLGDNVLITGHSAGISQGFPERFCALVIRNLNLFHQGKALENRVL